MIPVLWIDEDFWITQAPFQTMIEERERDWWERAQNENPLEWDRFEVARG